LQIGVSGARPGRGHDWGFSAAADLAGPDEAGVAVIKILSVGQL
jgi:hypothetical protein